MSGLKSNRKGKVGEREAAKALQDAFGVPVRRGVQHRGTPDSPDVIMDGLPLHIEVKRCERLHLRKALAQAEQESADDQIPIVLHRWNGGPWVMIMRLEKGMEFARSVATWE